jgi:SAM-dependent methyltransferase
MTDAVRVTACRLCDGPLDLVVSFTPTPPGDHYVTAERWNEPQPCYPLDVMACTDCGAVQLADTVNPELIYPDYLYTTSVSKGLSEHFSAYAADVVKRLRPKAGDLVVDIGSNDGTLLKRFRYHGCHVLGVDPAKAVGEQAMAVDGIETKCAFFSKAVAEDLRNEFGQPTIVTANHIMANVADLHDFAEGVKHLLAPDGTFVFETGYWPAIVDGNLIDTIEHEHIHYFAVNPLKRFFQRHGLHLWGAWRNTAKGGSLRGYVCHAPSLHRNVSVLELSVAEQDGRGVEPWVDRLKQNEQAVKALIEQDETWVGYGAAVGSTLQLYQFGLGEKLKCLVDANPQKVGRLSPGYHLPVKRPGELKAINPDKIVILAWRYADRIMAQHPEFTGKWIIPLPEVRCC